LPEKLKIETGLRVEHQWLFIESDYSLTTYPVFGPRLNIIYTPLRNLKYLDSLTLSLGVALSGKIPLQYMTINKKIILKILK